MAFFRTGMLGFGGGPAVIPLLQKEVVERYQWMNDDEFGDTIALSNTMPGPIATKLAGYIGYKVGGVWGLLTALAASVIPTVLLMVLLLGVLQRYKDVPWVQNMSQTVVPVVAVMLGVLAWNFVQQSQKALGWKIAIFLIVISVLLLEVIGLHPAILIAILIAVVLIPFIKRVVSK
ncbi:chromate transporter [Planococcus versutus]|uniref:Chromate transporter n=1 Tax=Planococcus versutus TaxID=1302659 RepID=A0A1B1RZ60_9BACL|nr:chromate transporter [Planococcus versutus]ANU26223.1 chromate transporter [Planococcus versutus]